MRFGLLKLLRRVGIAAIVPLLVALPVSVAVTTPASAQLVLTCATINQFNFDPVPAGVVGATRTETVSLSAGDVVTVVTGGLTAFFWSVDAVPVPGATANATASYTVSTSKNYIFFKSVTGGPGFVRFSCTPGQQTPNTPVIVPDNVTTLTDALAGAQQVEVSEAQIQNWQMLNALKQRMKDAEGQEERKITLDDCEGRRVEPPATLDEYNQRIAAYTKRVFEIWAGSPSTEDERIRLTCEYIALESEDYELGGVGYRGQSTTFLYPRFLKDDPNDPTAPVVMDGERVQPPTTAQNYLPIQSQINRSLDAIAQFFGGGRASGSVPLQSSNPDWTFELLFNANLIDTTFGALNRRSTAGTVTLLSAYTLDADTTIGLGLNVGGSSTQQPGSTINTIELGADLAVLRMLSPNLTLGGLVSYGLGLHQGTVNGVAVSYNSHTLGVAGELAGTIALNEFTLSPAVLAQLQYNHRPSFTTVGGVVPGADMFDATITAGATLSRDFYLLEEDVTVTPHVGLDLVFRANSVTPAPAGLLAVDAVSLKARAGVAIAWGNGLNISLNGTLMRGANTTTAGVSATLSAPIN